MKMLNLVLVGAILFGAGKIWAEESKKDVKGVMNEIYTSFSALRPFLTSEEKFSDPKNKPVIEKEMNRIIEVAQSAAHQKQLTAPGFKFSRGVLEEHLKETKRVFTHGNRNFARWMLNSTFSICMSCHSQMPGVHKMSFEGEHEKDFPSKFEKAEFLFAVRDFEAAMEIYNHLVLTYPDNGIQSFDAETALLRRLTYYLRIQRDLKGAQANIQKTFENKKLPEYMKNDLNAWLTSVNSQLKENLPSPKDLKPAQLEKFATTVLNRKISDTVIANNPKAADYLTLSSVLYEYLMANPESEMTPKVLYWLSLCDRSLNNNFFYSLANTYLKECITGYSNSPSAKLCLTEYEKAVKESYTGSSGMNLPSDVQQELDRLKGLVKNGKKAPKKK